MLGLITYDAVRWISHGESERTAHLQLQPFLFGRQAALFFRTKPHKFGQLLPKVRNKGECHSHTNIFLALAWIRRAEHIV